MSIAKRKGARSIKDIPVETLNLLNTGKLEIEWLSVDQKVLLKNVLQEADRIRYIYPILEDVEALQKKTVNTINEAIGDGLYEQAKHNDDVELFNLLSNHTSDVVRCWAAYSIGKNSNLNLVQLFKEIERFASDNHFGVREISWMVVRKSIATNLEQSIHILANWALSENEYVRRFSSEATRPRGVWCEHIEILKRKPELALPVIEPLKSDPSKYVQDSVGNWLNDASKSRPDFVLDICKKWQSESSSKETSYITKKALRTILKPKL